MNDGGLEWPRVTFTRRNYGGRWVFGRCARCRKYMLVPANKCWPVQYSDSWWARCDEWSRVNSRTVCKGIIRPPSQQDLEEAVVAAFIVGGPDAARQVWLKSGAARARRKR